MRSLFDATILREALAWLKLRIAEPSTWTGLAMIAVVLGSDPMQAHSLGQALSLILGGGLVASGPLPVAGHRR